MNAPDTQTAQGQPGLRRLQTAVCRACKAPIIWIQMGPRADGKPGGMMPLDAEWQYGNGQRNLVVLDEQQQGKLLVKPGREVLGREPHWGSCPARKRFKKKKAS